MVKYLKDATGRFTGSIGVGKTRTPTVSNVTHFTKKAPSPLRALSVSPEAISLDAAEDAYYFYFVNETDPSKYNGGVEEVITFTPAEPAGLRDQIEEKLFALQTALASDRTPKTAKDKEQTIKHLQALNGQLINPNGLPKLIKSAKVYQKIFTALGKLDGKTTYKWDLDSQALQKIHLYGRRLETLRPNLNKKEHAESLEIDLKENEPQIVNKEGNYASDLGKIYPIIKKEFNTAGIF